MRIHRCSRVEELFDELSAELGAPLGDPFVPDVIVVDSPGIERWLSMRLAERHGVCANVQFPRPAELIEQLQQAVRPGAAPVWDAAALPWAIAATLTHEDDPSLDIPRDYVTGADGIDDRRLVQLSLRLADLLQRYALYRPDRVAQWERSTGGDWQGAMWRHLVARLGPNHAGRAVADLIAALDAARGALPTRVCVFGIASLPPAFLEVLRALSRRSEVHLFVPTPSATGWDRHPLLRSLGSLGRDLLAQLGDPPAPSPAETSGSLLATLQSDLAVDRPPSGSETDDSIRFIACHGATRQLEVLRDELIGLLNADPTLEPRDIVVMCPDIETYAPLIDAVFSDGAAHSGFPALPYRLADLTLRRENPVAEALVALLALSGGRLRAGEVLDLLALEPIRRRFRIEADDIDTIRQWVAEVGIRWGADAAHRASFGRPERPEGTWRHGLDRLLTGVALDGAEHRLWQDVAPAEYLEGGVLGLLGRFVDFAETLLEQVADLHAPRAVPDWRARLAALADAMLATSDRESWLRRQVDAEVEAIATAATEAGLDELGLDGIRAALDGSLQIVRSTPAFVSGAITFCTLTPMRSIPFRVVALVGLDDDTFPRRGTRLAFDLIAQDPRPGDRSPRDDDRYLFLEAICAAREHLILTWTGHDATDGQERPPATVVQQLIDLVTTMTGASAPIRQAPLHPWSRRAFLDQRSFDTRMLTVARRLTAEPDPPRPLLSGPLPLPEPLSVSPNELASFFDNPSRALLKRRLGLSLDDEEETLAEEDPPALSGLERWQVGTLLLSRRLAGEAPDEARRLAVARGLLPLGTPGAEALDDTATAAEALAADALPLLSGRRRVVVLDLEVDGVRLAGSVPDVRDTGRTVVQFGRIGDHQLLRLWVHHVLLCAFDPGFSGRSWLVGVHPRSPVQGFGPLGDVALPLARALVTAWREGQASPLPFAAAPARAYLETDDLDAAVRKWHGDRRAGGCRYVQRALGPDYAPDERFATLAATLMAPMLDHLELD